jgi:hypothetical protein
MTPAQRCEAKAKYNKDHAELLKGPIKADSYQDWQRKDHERSIKKRNHELQAERNSEIAKSLRR